MSKHLSDSRRCRRCISNHTSHHRRRLLVVQVEGSSPEAAGSGKLERTSGSGSFDRRKSGTPGRLVHSDSHVSRRFQGPLLLSVSTHYLIKVAGFVWMKS